MPASFAAPGPSSKSLSTSPRILESTPSKTIGSNVDEAKNSMLMVHAAAEGRESRLTASEAASAPACLSKSTSKTVALGKIGRHRSLSVPYYDSNVQQKESRRISLQIQINIQVIENVFILKFIF